MMRNGMTCAVAVAVAAWWLVVPVVEHLEAQTPGVFSPVESDLSRTGSRSLLDPPADAAPRTIRSRLVRIDFGQLDLARADAGRSAGDVEPLALNLFDDTVFAAHVEWTAPTPSGYVLSGRLVGVPFGTMTLAVNGTVVAGTVRTLEATWRIRSAGAGLYRIQQVDLSTLPPGGEPLVSPATGDGGSGIDMSALPPDGEPLVRAANGNGGTLVDVVDVVAIDGPAIDMIVFYTPEARDHEGGTAEIEALIDLAVAETNQAYADSGVVQRLNLVRKEEVDYFEEGNLADDYGRFGDPSDGHMDDVFALQDAYAADLMHLVTLRDAEDSNDPCGLATSIVSPGNVQETASATSIDCGAMTFAHEVGHNMGLRHDRYARGDSNVPYPYSAGYVNQSAFDDGAPESSRWRTVMAYPDQCTNAGFQCTPLFRFSNPDQTYAGDPLGVPGDEPSNAVDGPADSRRSLNDTRWIVSNFRNSRDRILCKPVLFPERQVAPIDGGTFEVAVTIRHDCAWTAASEAEFVSVTRGARGTGPGVVEYEVDPNGGAERTGQLIISRQPFLIDQGGQGSGGVCDRTAQVLEAITAAARVDHCWEVTSEHLAAINILLLNDKRISALLPGDFAGMSGLVELNLVRNDLTTLPDGIFGGLSGLRHLILSENNLTALPSDAFAELSSLESLGLLNNDLTALPGGIFTGLSGLRQLTLSGNRLTALPERAFAGLSNLSELSMGGNELTVLAEGIFAELSSLETLIIQGNKLTALREEVFAGLSNLNRIWMGGNELTALPEEIFDGLSNLDNLALGPNPLRSLPDRLFAGLPKLGFLDLANAQLNALPPEIFADVPLLHGLWLWGNQLNELPAGVFSGLSNLRNLELNDNPGAPFTLTLELAVTERTSTGGTVAVEVAEGAPFDMTLSLSATGGTLSARTATVGAGETASPDVTVNREESTVTVQPGEAPPIPRGSGCGRPLCFTGLQLAVGGPVELSN